MTPYHRAAERSGFVRYRTTLRREVGMGIFSFFKAAGGVLARIGAGEVLSTRDMQVNRGLTVLRFNVNRDTRTGEVFLVLGMLSGGSHQFLLLDADEVDELANVARSTQIAVRAARARSGLT